MTITPMTCEIARCGSVAMSTTNGIRTCDRCRREFVSVGAGAVYRDGRWHGVRGAVYDVEQTTAHPGLARQYPGQRNNPAQNNRWNAWRYPTPAEIARGRGEEDMFWVGAEIDRSTAEHLLRDGGQIQFGADGEVVVVD